MRKTISRIVFFASLFAIWELLVRAQLWPDYLLPAPGGVGRAIADGFRDGDFLAAIGGSLKRLVIGYAIAIVAGVVIGLLIATVEWLNDTLGLLVMGLQALPSICWLPLALLWFGLSEKAIVFVVIMGAVLSIAQATADGVRNTPPIYMNAARNLGARGIRLYTSVVLPSALPSIVTGMKLGWSFAWRSLMAGELLYALPGLGHLLMLGREMNDMSQVVAVMLVIIVLGLLTDHLVFGRWERRIRRQRGLASPR